MRNAPGTSPLVFDASPNPKPKQAPAARQPSPKAQRAKVRRILSTLLLGWLFAGPVLLAAVGQLFAGSLMAAGILTLIALIWLGLVDMLNALFDRLAGIPPAS